MLKYKCHIATKIYYILKITKGTCALIRLWCICSAGPTPAYDELQALVCGSVDTQESDVGGPVQNLQVRLFVGKHLFQNALALIDPANQFRFHFLG